MSTKLLLVILSVCIVITAGCKKKTDQPSSNVSADNVKKEFSEAVDASSDYIQKQKDAIMEKATETYTNLDTQTKQMISDIKDSGKEAWQKTSEELESKLAVAKQKLDELKQSGKENMQDAQDAYNVAIDELKDAYTKTKDEMTKDSN